MILILKNKKAKLLAFLFFYFLKPNPTTSLALAIIMKLIGSIFFAVCLTLETSPLYAAHKSTNFCSSLYIPFPYNPVVPFPTFSPISSAIS